MQTQKKIISSTSALKYIRYDEGRCQHMLIIPIKEGENIDRALKRYKRKFDRTKTMKNLRNRKNFTKPSVAKRAQRIKASYVQRLRTQEEVG